MKRGGGTGSAYARFGASLVLMFGVIVAVNAAAPAAVPRWPVVRTPSPPGPPNGQLYGVSCASATDCMAVGSNSSGGGVIIIDNQARFRRWSKAACATPAECLAPRARQRAVDPREVVIIGGPTTLIEHWDGSGWSFAPAPTVPIGSQLNLTAVDCPAANTCFAVGSMASFTPTSFDIQPVVVRWNGSTWTTLTVPDPPDSLDTALNAIDCTSATHCVAAGDYLTGNPRKFSTIHDHAVIADWNGSAWTIASTTAPAGSTDEFLGDVSCAGGTCVAVGGYLDGSGFVHALTQTSTGAAWSPGTAPTPAGQTDADFVSVACTGATTCTAGGAAFSGSFGDDPSFVPLLERWNGATWAMQSVPLPADTDGAGVYSVACAAAADCTAVGFAQPNGVFDPEGFNDISFHVHWNGSTWSVTTGPDPTPFAGLFEVACPAANTCFAVAGQGVVDQWNGSTWLVSHFAGKASQSSLSDIDCLSATNCFAVGAFRSNADDQPLVEHWNGSSWQTMSVPAPTSGGGGLSAVACVNADDCTAVGARNAGEGLATLIEHWNGSTWSIVPSPTPHGGLAVLTGIDCAAAGRCVAVGVILTDSFSERSFSAVSARGRWTLAKLPLPDFAEISEVTSVSCATTANCFAAGRYLLVTGDRQAIVKGLLAHWNGSRWQERSGAPLPGDPEQTQLTNVSCSSATRCFALGLYLIGDPNSQSAVVKSFVERWNGRGWQALPSANLIPFTPDDVSCRSGISCYAVGTDFGISGPIPGVIHWNGHRWNRASVGTPSGATRSSITGIDCPTSRVCFAVGSYQNAAGSFTLALRGT